MAATLQTPDGELVRPAAHAKVRVAQGPSGLATAGVIAIVGEADMGPDQTLETTLEDAAFGPTEASAVKAKYGSGPVVDAYLGAVTASADDDVNGSPTKIYIVKTNQSTKASHTLPKIGGGTYGSLYDKSYGALGNMISYTIEATDEVVPTTGAFTYIPPAGSANLTLRVNGGAALAAAVTAAMTPTAFVSLITGLTGPLSTGGADRLIIQAARVSDASTLALAVVSGNDISLTISTAWSVTPTAGDTLVIPDGSVVEGPGGLNANVGAYVITSATSSVIFATKLSDFDKPAAVPGTITAPTAVSATDIVSTTADAVAYSPVIITLEAADPIEGAGKALEINQLATGTDLFERCAFVLGTTDAVEWLSKTGEPVELESGTEYQVRLRTQRQFDNVSADFRAGGEVALVVGYTGTTATLTITSTTLTTTRTGGSGADLSLTLADFPSIADLAAYIDSQTGYTCDVGTRTLGTQPPTVLDRVSAIGICTTFGNEPGRVKIDAFRFYDRIRTGSTLVQLGNPPARAAAGLPDEVTSATFLAGGAKNGTTDTIFNAAIDRLERSRINFLVPAFSADAADDIVNGLTESSSTYTLENILAYVKTHVLKMSQFKRRRRRQAFLSAQITFDDVKDMAADLATSRASLTFLDVKDVKSTGGVYQFQPWMGAAKAAGFQAAAGYRAFYNKQVNCSGVVSFDGSYDELDVDQVDDAIRAGLLPMENAEEGGVKFVTDQTTYGTDNNFVYNAIQVQYAADIVASTAEVKMQRIVGQSTADLSPSSVLTMFEGVLGELFRQKFLSASSDAPKGFRGAIVKQLGSAFYCTAEVKVTESVRWVIIEFLVTQVQGQAGA